MIPSRRLLAVVAALSLNVAAQTPMDFMPGTLVNLGVKFPTTNISPAGTEVDSLALVSTPPTVTIPAVALTGPNGEMVPDRKFMVFMIDMDVQQGNIATTVLHWYQPDLVVQAPPQGMAAAMAAGAIQADTQLNLVLNSTKAINGPAQPATVNGAADYFGPGPPPGPPHRYVQVLFSQPRNFSVPACFSNIISQPGGGAPDVQQRVGFDLTQFIQAGQLAKRPIAGNYFRAQNPMPGSLNQNANQMALRNNMCPGVSAAGMAAPPPMARARRWL